MCSRAASPPRTAEDEPGGPSTGAPPVAKPAPNFGRVRAPGGGDSNPGGPRGAPAARRTRSRRGRPSWRSAGPEVPGGWSRRDGDANPPSSPSAAAATNRPSHRDAGVGHAVLKQPRAVLRGGAHRDEVLGDADPDERDLELEALEAAVAEDDLRAGPRLGDGGSRSRIQEPLLPRPEVLTVEAEAARALARRLEQAPVRDGGAEPPELVVALHLEVRVRGAPERVVALRLGGARGKERRVGGEEEHPVVVAAVLVGGARDDVRVAVVHRRERDHVARAQTRPGLRRDPRRPGHGERSTRRRDGRGVVRIQHPGRGKRDASRTRPAPRRTTRIASAPRNARRACASAGQAHPTPRARAVPVSVTSRRGQRSQSKKINKQSCDDCARRVAVETQLGAAGFGRCARPISTSHSCARTRARALPSLRPRLVAHAMVSWNGSYVLFPSLSRRLRLLSLLSW